MFWIFLVENFELYVVFVYFNPIAFNMYPNVAIITLNGMMRICNRFTTNFTWEFDNHGNVQLTYPSDLSEKVLKPPQKAIMVMSRTAYFIKTYVCTATDLGGAQGAHAPRKFWAAKLFVMQFLLITSWATSLKNVITTMYPWPLLVVLIRPLSTPPTPRSFKQESLI